MKRYTFDEIKKLDQALHQLAIYEITHGRIIIPQDIEDALALQEKSAEKFNEFKRLIQEGDCTFEFIKNMVLAQNGPIPKHEWDIENLDTIANRSLSEIPFLDLREDSEEERLINGLLRGVMLTVRDAIQDSQEAEKKTITNTTTTEEPYEDEKESPNSKRSR